MIEMIQAVHWALEQPCLLRFGRRWQGPHKTHRQLKDVVAYSDAVANDCIMDDICVTAHASHQAASAGEATLPIGGFSVSKAFARFGGVEKVQEACNGCDANVGACEGRLWGGCHGSLEVWPHSPDLECALRSFIANCQVEQKFQRCFSQTAPAWFGLWMNSPLSTEQCEFLQAFFGIFSAEVQDGGRDLDHFLAGLGAAIQRRLPMHVEMALPRIGEFGGDLILAHCPRCKAEARPGRCHPAPVEREYQCEVCGHVFWPAETERMVRREHDELDTERLEQTLGKDGWDEFAREFLRRRGCSEAYIDDLVAEESRQRRLPWAMGVQDP